MPGNARKSEILGMPFGTACYRLRKKIMFAMLKGRVFSSKCHACTLEIETIDDLTVEHIKPWQVGGAALFWDLDNIAFSHEACNKVHTHGGGRPTRKKSDTEFWCNRCKSYLPPEAFYKNKRSATGLTYYCKTCS
jgi:hypothetical protein